MLSAASQNVSALLRALAENHRVEILQRPQIMTLDNQPAFIQVGQRVPQITAVTNNAVTGNTNSITLNNVGLILGVTPRISPDGLVVMQIDAEKSELESDATGIPIFTSPTGQVIRSPIIDATTAQTTVAAMSEQTVVLGGLITKSKTKEHHGVPVLDDIPVLNNFFRYDSDIEEKTELLIIMTPHIVKNQADADALKRTEAAKMSWCINDVTAIYGEAGLRKRSDEWTDGEVPVIYPDSGPLPVGNQPAGPEVIPTPNSQPARGPDGGPDADAGARPRRPAGREPRRRTAADGHRRASAPGNRPERLQCAVSGAATGPLRRRDRTVPTAVQPASTTSPASSPARDPVAGLDQRPTSPGLRAPAGRLSATGQPADSRLIRHSRPSTRPPSPANRRRRSTTSNSPTDRPRPPTTRRLRQ